ncbi:hypothetical protein [Candidatus Electrothrix sp.]|uniref:hypothetical protein n=1 Tax=Candidatus Electrothrix sp. TaxID=2170559 RepID=UPI0040562AA1
MNSNISFFIGILLALPTIVNANENSTIHCDVSLENKCIVKSARSIRAIRVEIYRSGDNNSTEFVKKEFQDCPKEVSIVFDSLQTGSKMFIDTCDGSSFLETI